MNPIKSCFSLKNPDNLPSLKQASNVTTTMSLQFNYTHLSKLTLICTLAFVGFFATKVSAWGANGHRIVGAIAEHHLDADAKQQVSTILAGHSMARVSTWADEMRSSPIHSGKSRPALGITSISTPLRNLRTNTSQQKNTSMM